MVTSWVTLPPNPSNPSIKCPLLHEAGLGKGGGGETSEDLPLQKKREGENFSHAERGGGQKVLKPEVLAILKGGRKKFPPFKRGDAKSFHHLKGGRGAKCFTLS